MSETENENTQQDDTEAAAPAPSEGGYQVTDLAEGQKPDPLGDASLSAQERATATGDE